MNDDSLNNRENFYHQDKLKNSLIQTSIFLSSFDIFRNGITIKLRELHGSNIEFNEETGEPLDLPGENYREEILALYPSDEFHACCLWLKSMSAINDDDLRDIARIRKQRNIIAFGARDSKSAPGVSSITNNLNKLISIQNKIDKWWYEDEWTLAEEDSQSGNNEKSSPGLAPGSNILFLSLMAQLLMEVILF